ncbi:MAG: DUF1847 domain-containing protein [Candidatus Lokiarchaeota archaeon]|nr:DUF1847 domain-containing protein [Candidatus Lokiarchaeota archaeon]
MALEKDEFNNGEKRDSTTPTCFKCDSISQCTVGKPNKELENCPMMVSPEITKKAMELYKTDEFLKKSTNVASIVEAKGYKHWPRLKDTIEYAKGMGFKKLGLASCVGLQKEAELTAEILLNYGFEVCSVCCKTGAISKLKVGVPEEFSMISKTGYPIGLVTCNPVAQALILNKAKTDLNLIVGLCVGHDINFTRLSEAPVTTFIAKDRSSPHNPATVLYTHYGKAFFSADLKKITTK